VCFQHVSAGEYLQALQSTLSDASYDSSKVAGWSNAVIDAVLKGLVGLGRPFRYVVTCIIMQRTGAGLHTAAGAIWDTKKDGMCVLTCWRWRGGAITNEDVSVRFGARLLAHAGAKWLGKTARYIV